MFIKKSALLLILLSAGSVSLLVFSSAINTPGSVDPVKPAVCSPATCCNQSNDIKTFSPFEMISQIMFRTLV